MNKTLTEFIDFVAAMTKRPGMFGINNVEDLNLVVLGYTVATKDNTVEELLGAFTEFINRDFDTNNSYHWALVLRLNSATSDHHSLKLFGDIFSKFLAAKYDVDIVFGMAKT